MMKGCMRLLLILVLMQGFLSKLILISQKPTVSAPEGGVANLQCNFSVTDPQQSVIGSYKWTRHAVNGTDVFDSSGPLMGRVRSVKPNDFVKGLANIWLHDVTMNDSGMYFCQISLLVNTMLSGYGNGTFLNVTEVSHSQEAIIILNGIRIAVGALIFFIAIPAFLYCECQGTRHPAQK
ncbi:hypothetical protein XENTR_v10012587 [Xenopus tropicalis]|uniref:Natural cytotoxicity triggering receptor 3 n=1 Tax=Xenopus tropicalis TaxID=8364 RepID=A0A803KCV7_XENTR|nr:hypothetical protein XENTR_v10012587 [Xenopus tropicalis]